MSGTEIKNLMRATKTTIAGVAQAMGVTQARVREVRVRGVAGALRVTDWRQGIYAASAFSLARDNARLWAECPGAKRT